MSTIAPSANTTGLQDSQNTIRAIQLTCYAVVIAIGSIGNFLLCAVLTFKKKRKTSEYFILNLATADLLTCALGIPLDMAELVLGRWPYGVYLCKVIYPLQTVLTAVSVATLLSMALERHRVITEPLKPRLTGKLLMRVILVEWLGSVVLVSPYAVVLKGSATECTEEWPGEEYPKAFTMCIFLLLYMIPLCIITAAYIRVIARLHRDSKRIKGVIGALITSQRGRNLAKSRFRSNIHVVMVFIFVVVAFALCFLPYHVMWLWNDYGSGAQWEHFNTALTFSQIMVYVNSAINPFIFGTLNKRMRSWKTCCGKADTSHTCLRLASPRNFRFESKRRAPPERVGQQKNVTKKDAQYTSSV